jgi:uncharacterized protein involved in exopolysaccharide biosynthesis
MSTNISMKVDTGEKKRVARREPVRVRPPARVPRRRRSRQLIIALALVIVAGFLLGLGVPIHP